MEKIKSFFSKFLSSEMFLIVLGIFSILPFIIISFFNQPSADDFAYTMETIKHGVFQVQVWFYQNWSGRYFSCAVNSLNPLVFKMPVLIKVVPIVLITLLFFSFYKLGSLFFTDITQRGTLLLSAFFVFLYFFYMPNVPEGIYWYTGAVTYQLANILTCALFYCIIKGMQTKKTKFLILSVLLISFIIGSNETSMLMIDIIIGLIFVFNFITDKKINMFLSVLLFCAGVFSVIVLLAPGNSNRLLLYSTSHQTGYSIYISAVQVIKHLIKWSPFTIVCIIIFFDTVKKYIKDTTSTIFNVNPFLAFIVFLLILFAGFFPGYWSTNVSPPARAKDVIFFFYVIGVLYLSFVIFFYLKKKEKSFIIITPWARYLLVVIILINLGHENNIRTAYEDLLKGTAYRYDREFKERYEIMKNTTGDDCIVPMIKSYAPTIGGSDITTNDNCSRNTYYAEYFQVKSIKTKTE